MHVHELVDFVSDEARRCAVFVDQYLQEHKKKVAQGNISVGSNVIYIVPNKYVLGRDNIFFLRPFIVKNNATLILSKGGKVIKKKKLLHIQPSEMIRFIVKKEVLNKSLLTTESSLEISIQ